MTAGDPTQDAAGSERTVDAFHRGAFVLVQPAAGGHRAGLDAMILAAAVPDRFAGRLADLGAGAGAAGLAVAARCPDTHVDLIERDAAMCDCARATLEHPVNARFAARCSLLMADVTLAGARRAEAGLEANAYDFAIMNPPFNAALDRASPNARRRDAHVLEDGLFERWLRTAAAIVKPGGGLALIMRPQSLKPVLDAMDRRFGGIRIKPIHPRPDRPAIRLVIRARRDRKGALDLETPLFLHGASGNRFAGEADAVINGKAGLFGD